jgi:hypothetical protein
VSAASLDTLDFWKFVGAAGTVAVFLAAALSLMAGARSRWRRTIGRRRDHYRRLGRLGANAQVSFFNAVLGAPPALRRSLLAEVTSVSEHAGDTSIFCCPQRRHIRSMRFWAEWGVFGSGRLFACGLGRTLCSHSVTRERSALGR